MKQYVRHYGWLEVIADFVQRKRRHKPEEPVTYLTLPAEDALDIGLLYRAGLLRRTEKGFPDVAICDNQAAAVVQARLGTFRGCSAKSFAEAVRWPSGDLVRCFPFDIVNFDASHAIITGGADTARGLENLDALQWVFRLQRGRSFLLLLTTKPDVQAGAELKRLLEDNLAREPAFVGTYSERFGSADPGLCLADYTDFTQLMLPKLVAKIARENGYETTEHFAARYARRPRRAGAYDMIAHSFELDPIGRTGSRKYEPRYSRPREHNIFCEDLPRRVSSRAALAYEGFITSLLLRKPTDVRACLAQAPELSQAMASEVRSLDHWWETQSAEESQS